MKPTVWLGSLLVVPVFAALLSLTSGENRTTPRPSVDSPDDHALPERLEVAGSEAPPVSFSRADARDTPHEGAAEFETPPEIPKDEMDDENDPVERARRLRLPVILAIRGNHASADSRREAMLEALRNSGPSDEAWTQESPAVFDDWSEAISGDVGLRAEFASARCYQAGCEMELSFPDRASYEHAADKFRSLQEDNAPHGGRVQTPAVELENGQVRASWIMLRPDTSDS